MTACAIEPPSAGAEDGGTGGAPCVLTMDGTYAARLARAGECWFAERWTLDGPEPYAVPLPADQPEEPGTEVQPLADGRVLIHRVTERRHVFSLLYPTGPGTGELPLGAVECPEPGTRLTLLPPAPGGVRAYALAVGPRVSTVWQVAGGSFGPEWLAEVPGRCSGGVWLDRAGRMLALDREQGGQVKTVVVDLERAEVSPLLQIAAGSDDRLLLADPDSGLLLISSDAPSPGRERLGWGVLGSTLPVRFPESLRVPDCAVTPFAIQPGQVLTPEGCAVALRLDGPLGGWVGVWRPAERRVSHFPAPEGWLAGTGLWTSGGVLRLPYATRDTPCGMAELTAPGVQTAPQRRTTARAAPTAPAADPGAAGTARTATASGGAGAAGSGTDPAPEGTAARPGAAGALEDSGAAGVRGPAGDGAVAGVPKVPSEPSPAVPVAPAPVRGPGPVVARPVPLQQAPLGRLVTN